MAVDGIFPNDAAIVRPVGIGVLEHHEEWRAGRRSLSAETLAKRRRGVQPLRAADWRAPARRHDGGGPGRHMDRPFAHQRAPIARFPSSCPSAWRT